MAELRKITKTGAELQDIVQLLDELTGEVFIPANTFQIIQGTPSWTAVGNTAGYALDATTVEAITANFRIPNDLPGLDVTKPVNCYVVWSAVATTGDVVYDVDYVAIAIDEDRTTAGSTLVTTNTANSTANGLSESAAFAIPGNTFMDKDLFSFVVRRQADDAGDTMTGDANIVGVRISYTSNPNIV